MFIFHQVDAQREFKERLMVLSGLDPLMRIKLHQEMLVNRADHLGLSTERRR